MINQQFSQGQRFPPRTRVLTCLSSRMEAMFPWAGQKTTSELIFPRAQPVQGRGRAERGQGASQLEPVF